MGTNIKREPRGTSTGGQFAAHSNPESGLILEEPAHPYDSWTGWRVKDIRAMLDGRPDDEPIIAWIKTRPAMDDLIEMDLDEGESAPEITDKVWVDACEGFESEAESDRGGIWGSAYEMWADAARAAVPGPPAYEEFLKDHHPIANPANPDSVLFDDRDYDLMCVDGRIEEYKVWTLTYDQERDADVVLPGRHEFSDWVDEHSQYGYLLEPLSPIEQLRRLERED